MGSCEHGNKPLVSIMAGNVLISLATVFKQGPKAADKCLCTVVLLF
jgi:hypothetical protein